MTYKLAVAKHIHIYILEDLALPDVNPIFVMLMITLKRYYLIQSLY